MPRSIWHSTLSKMNWQANRLTASTCQHVILAFLESMTKRPWRLANPYKHAVPEFWSQQRFLQRYCMGIDHFRMFLIPQSKVIIAFGISALKEAKGPLFWHATLKRFAASLKITSLEINNSGKNLIRPRPSGQKINPDTRGLGKWFAFVQSSAARRSCYAMLGRPPRPN